jgi:hypothetical protein
MEPAEILAEKAMELASTQGSLPFVQASLLLKDAIAIISRKKQPAAKEQLCGRVEEPRSVEEVIVAKELHSASHTRTVKTHFSTNPLLKDAAISFQSENPKKHNTASHSNYESYKTAESYGEFLEKGGTKAIFDWDYERGFVQIFGQAGDQAYQAISRKTKDVAQSRKKESGEPSSSKLKPKGATSSIFPGVQILRPQPPRTEEGYVPTLLKDGYCPLVGLLSTDLCDEIDLLDIRKLNEECVEIISNAEQVRCLAPNDACML